MHPLHIVSLKQVIHTDNMTVFNHRTRGLIEQQSSITFTTQCNSMCKVGEQLLHAHPLPPKLLILCHARTFGDYCKVN